MPDRKTEDVARPSCPVGIEQGDGLKKDPVPLQHSVNEQFLSCRHGGDSMSQCDCITVPLSVDTARDEVPSNNFTDPGACVVDCTKSSIMDDSVNLTTQSSPKSDTKKDSGNASGELLSNISKLQTENAANSASAPDVSGSQSDKEISNSDIMEDDVKVCDICGDVGREELLAVCSRCSDGAEHTYCMRIMLLKLPEGDWLCEECKLKADEDKINNKSEDAGILSNAPPLPNIDSRLPAPNLAKKGTHNSHASIKVSSANNVVSSETNTKTGETVKSEFSSLGTIGNPKPSSVRDALCKITASQVKSGNVTLNPKSQPATSIVMPALPSNSSKPDSRLSSPRGNSLPSMDILKSKVKRVMETLKPKTKSVLEPTTIAAKKESAQSLVRSASLRSQSINTGNTDSASKTYPVNRADSQNSLGKQKGLMERKNSFILDRPLSNLSVSVPTNIASPKLEQNGAKPEGKVGAGETRKQPPITPKSAGLLSFSGQPISTDQKSSQINPKEEATASLRTGDVVSDAAIQQGPSLSERGSGRSDKNREAGGSRSLSLAAVRSYRCQKCNEMGHLTQFCSVDKNQLSALKPSALKPSCEQNVSDSGNKTSKWRHAIEAALLKTQTKKTFEVPTQSSDLLLSTNNLNHENSCKVVQSNPTIRDRSLSALEGSKPTVYSDVQQRDISQMQGPLSGDLIFDIGGLKSKFAVQDILSGQASPHTSLNASAIPELDCIWQGSFEVQKNGRFSDKCYGVQAHLSTLASPKVSAVVTKFPHEVQLEEVSCTSAWPWQFRTKCPMEENIALFFFATDGESCEKSYNRLLENILQNDLALKGSLDGVELLIFPSIKLPESCQRWNRLFFLWGIFSACQPDIPVLSNGMQMKFCENRLGVPDFRGSPATPIVEASANPVAESSEQWDKELPVCDKAIKSENRCHTTDLNLSEENSPDFNRVPSGKQFAEAGAITEQVVFIDGSTKLSLLSDSDQVMEDRKDGDIYREKTVSNTVRKDTSDRRSPQTCGVEVGSAEKISFPSCLGVTSKQSEVVPVLAQLPLPKPLVASEKRAEDNNTYEGIFQTNERIEMATVSSKAKDHVFRRESPSWEARLNLKHSSSSSPERAVQASGLMSRTLWKESDHLSSENVRPYKKVKPDADDRCLIIQEENRGHEFSSKVYPVHGSFLGETREGSATCNEAFRKGSTTSEMAFFPVDTVSPKEPQLSGFVSFPIVAPSVEDTLEHDTPNLDLALGATRKPKLGILPLFCPSTGKGSEEPKPPDPMMDVGDDVSASLSLSLASPFPREQQQSREGSKRVKPDTSLFLFGRFSDS